MPHIHQPRTARGPGSNSKWANAPPRADLRPEHLTAIVDTREQTPLNLAPLRTVTAALPTGDYSLRGLEHVVAIERKNLADLIACIGQERQRFDREVRRLLAYPVRALVVEAEWSDLDRGDWRGQVTPVAAIGSCLGWIAAGLPILMAGDHSRAGQFVSRLLFIAARRRWREARSLVTAVHERDPSQPADGIGTSPSGNGASES